MAWQDAFSLAGRVAVVTGGNSGIGAALAEGLGVAGARVVLVARREDALADVQSRLQSLGVSSSCQAGDLLDRPGIAALASLCAQPYGNPDILVNGAGINLRQPADEISLESWDQTINLNLSAPFFLAQALLPAMQDKGFGRIINIASLQSKRAFKNGLAYGAAKGGVSQLTRAMAEAWSGHGVTCNAIAPGFFPTPLTAPVFNDPQTAKWAADQTAIGRNGRMEDLHGPAVFLASQAAEYVTGQTLFVDGGFSAK